MGTRKVVGGIFALAFIACAGPRVTATNVEIVPSPRSGFYRVDATLLNKGGEGEAKVTVHLRSTTDDRIYSKSEAVDLRAREHLDVVIDVAAPAGRYFPTVDVESPPN